MADRMNDSPVIRFRAGKRLSINKKALHTLGKPAYILFYLNKPQNELLIGVSDEMTDLSFKIKEYYYSSTRYGFKIENSLFVNTILKITNWNCNTNYTMIGRHIEGLNMLAFKFDDAVKETIDVL